METSYLEEMRLTSFKSFADQVLPLDAMTLLVGRNGSGKSNALDALWCLARLASGEDVRDALDGGREGPAVRGGAAGCVPFGKAYFEVGCTVRTGDDRVTLSVAVGINPEVRILGEGLQRDDEWLFRTVSPDQDSGDVEASWGSDHREIRFRSNRLCTSQVLARIPATPEGQRIHLAAAQVLTALRAVFVLDPVPPMMRGYVPERDVLLRRDGENLSAAVGDLLAQPETATVLSSAMSSLNEQAVVDVATTRSDLGDVMLTLTERFDGRDEQVPARVMSDGSLRFLAILVALLQAPTLDTSPSPLASEDALVRTPQFPAPGGRFRGPETFQHTGTTERSGLGQTMVVIEELENGLHASQASLLVTLIREQVHHRRARALATAHSPAVLNALAKDEHQSLIVCQRDEQGHSTLRRLIDLPNYLDIVVGGGLGKAAEQDALRARSRSGPSAVDVLDEVLGR